MKIAISGASGLIGGALAADLAAGGHEVLRLVRRRPMTPDEARWDPYGPFDAAPLEGLDAVVHLAGAGIGDRYWTARYKREIRESRVQGTGNLAAALAGLDAPPRVLVTGSGTGYYGDTGDTAVDESAGCGAGFLAPLVADWEAAARPVEEAGVRLAHARTGIVLTPAGGLLGRLLPLFRLGLGGRLGNGRQWTSWISLADEVAALRFLIGEERATGPYNLTAPAPVTNGEFTKALAHALRRPAVLAVPAPLLRLALRDFADELPLVSQRALPARLREAGFAFRDPELGPALSAMLTSGNPQEWPKKPG